MKKAFFSRVEINMSFASLIAEAKQQMKAGYKPIDYEVITEIYLSQEEFCTLMNKIQRIIIAGQNAPVQSCI